MEDARTEQLFEQAEEIFQSLDKEIADLKASVAALKVILAARLNPNDPSAGLNQIEKFEQLAREADPSAEKLREFGDLFEVQKLIRKHGCFET